MKKIFDFQKFKKSLIIAFSGLKSGFLKEQSFRIQVFVGFFVLILMLLFPLSFIERAILLLTIGVVLGLELINSQIEKFLDIIHPKFHPQIKLVKDLSSAAVLLIALSSILVGLLIFLPHFLELFK